MLSEMTQEILEESAREAELNSSALIAGRAGARKRRWSRRARVEERARPATLADVAQGRGGLPRLPDH